MTKAPPRRAKIQDVAEAAGVAIKTVSRVLNNEPNVREETRQRVLAIGGNVRGSVSLKLLPAEFGGWIFLTRGATSGAEYLAVLAPLLKTGQRALGRQMIGSMACRRSTVPCTR